MSVRLIHANGSTVLVDKAKVDALLASGFSRPVSATDANKSTARQRRVAK